MHSTLLALSTRSHKSEGYTLLELVVSVVIIGILATIAIPTFLGQASRAKEAEAKNAIAAFNKNQILYRVENPGFASTFESMGLGLPTETTNYIYVIENNASNRVGINAVPKDSALKTYTGDVLILPNGIAATIICESEVVNTAPLRSVDSETCGEGFSKL